MAKKTRHQDLQPSGFFAFRTPLLPFEELEAWGTDLRAPAAGDSADELAEALSHDRQLLRRRLRELIARPEIHEALFVASPSLEEGLGEWRKDPESKKGKRAEEALVRYFLRMSARPTPFGLFSGCSLGHLGDKNRLSLVARAEYQRHTRLDMDYLFALCEDLGRSPEMRQRLLYRPNSSLYLAAGRLRYAEARLRGKVRSHHLVAVESADYLQVTLDRARGGATLGELAEALVAWDPDGEVTREDAEEFVGELLDSQLLVNDLSPPVTGPEPIHDMIQLLSSESLRDESSAALPTRQRLQQARDALGRLDASGLGNSPKLYHDIAQTLRELSTRVELPRLFQVDMIKPVVQASLGPTLLTEVDRVMALLDRLSQSGREDALTNFCQSFTSRYEDSRSVPLLEVLDEEVGIGFNTSGATGAEAAPLLEGLAIRGRGQADERVPWGPMSRLLLGKLEKALAAGAREIEITEKDLGDFPEDGDKPLPSAMQVMLSLAAESDEAMDRGEFTLLFRGAHGPSGARLLGRFCHADPELRALTEAHLRAEEAHDPDVIYAEVVHLPEGRLGNILSRPVMRDHEIPFLGRGGGKAEHQIPVSDLLVTVQGQTVFLTSKSRGKRVIPRLTSAHNYSTRSLGVYRFLCTLQSQGSKQGLGFNWGPFEGLSFLPRVVSGRSVLSRARWLVRREEIQRITKPKGDSRYAEVQKWRRESNLPTRFLLADGDNELLVDLENILSLDSFLALSKRRPSLTLNELYPGSEELCARGPEGRFTSEIIIPYERKVRETPPAPARAKRPEPVARVFPPGSEWLYMKVYGGTATCDRILAEAVAPLARQAQAQGACDHWFFIRYGDPDWHLRLRFHGEPQRLHQEVLPLLYSALNPLMGDGRIWRMQIDTYERETERYGGPAGIDLAEQLAHVDSEAVLAIVQALEGDEGAAARWRLALKGCDLLLADLGFDDAKKLEVMEQMQRSFATEFRADANLRKQMANRLRQERKELDALLEQGYDENHPLAPGLAALEERSRRLAPIAAELRRQEAQGKLTAPLSFLAPSYIHMFNNRLLRSEARAQEMVLYDFLLRLNQSRAARKRSAKKKPR